MDIKKYSAFTLAEVLVVMLVLSIIMAAFAPVMTTRNKVDIANPWKWAKNNSDIYYGLGANQTAVIGQNSVGVDDAKARLVLSTSDNNQAHILFKKGAAYLGKLVLTEDNILIGNKFLVKGTGNTVIGVEAFNVNDTGINNTAIGGGALTANTSGSNNTSVGLNACSTVTTGSSKTCIGANATPLTGSIDATSADEQIFIGSTSKYNSAVAPLLITNTAAGGIDLNHNTRVAGTLMVQGVLVTPSDKRLKNIEGENKSGLEQIRELRVFDYTFKDDKTKTPRVGVMAQDLQQIFPDAVGKTQEGVLSIRQEDMFYAVINAVKEIDMYVQGLITETRNILAKIKDINTRITAQEEEIKTLKEQNAALEARIQKLETRMK